MILSWLFGARRLRRLGVLGMNRRNAACILDRNPRALFPTVDDKLRLRDLCRRIGVPTPAVYAVVGRPAELRHLGGLLGRCPDVVIKPNRGSGGRGVLVLTGPAPGGFRRHDGAALGLDGVRRHVADILSGLYSLGGRPDQALLQQRVRLHPAFEPVAVQGIPDVRVVLYRGEPAMAMLRLPTRQSGGRANLHQGGLGAGIDLATGRTHHAVQGSRRVVCHPDSGVTVIGRAVPNWGEVLDLSRRVARAVGLGYVGVDVVIDADDGPLLLEANARPGLAIQIANGRGLLPRLEAIDDMLDRETSRLAPPPLVFGTGRATSPLRGAR
jgi:alpha-L-glutamate ligase-like protein